MEKAAKRDKEGRRRCVEGSAKVGEFLRCMETTAVDQEVAEFIDNTLPLSILFLNEGMKKCM